MCLAGVLTLALLGGVALALAVRYGPWLAHRAMVWLMGYGDSE